MPGISFNDKINGCDFMVQITQPLYLNIIKEDQITGRQTLILCT